MDKGSVGAYAQSLQIWPQWYVTAGRPHMQLIHTYDCTLYSLLFSLLSLCTSVQATMHATTCTNTHTSLHLQMNIVSLMELVMYLLGALLI